MRNKSTVHILQSIAKQKDPKTAVVGSRSSVSQRGFTLIELMVVVILLGMIFGAVANAVTGVNRRGRDSKRQTDLLTIQSALQQYYADEHVYPQTMATLTTGGPFTGPSGKIYLSNTPIDPSDTSNPYCYQSQIAQTAGACDNTINSLTKCEYYLLCANLENAPAAAIPCTCNTKPYNFSAHAP